MEPSRKLADFVVSHRYDDLPQEVIHEAKRSLLNWLGVAIGASQHPTVEIALQVVEEVGGAPVATILGRDERTDVLHASFLNGTSSHVFDFDDTHLQTIIHPSGPVAAPLFALAELDRLSGAELIHAFVLGVEAECRIGNAVYPAHYDVGWHITATAGVFGAAAAAAKARRLDTQRTNCAFGLAATQSSGLREMFGTMTKPFHVGHAAKSGLFGALLAERGFTSSEQSIEALRGFANVLSTKRDLGQITEGLGGTYELLKNTYKPFACGIVIHPAIDACVQIRQQLEGEVTDIAAIELRVNPLVLELTGKTTPRTGLEGKFSVFHSAAVALLDGEAGEAQYSDERVLAPEVVELRSKVVAEPSPEVREDEVHAVVRTFNGQSIQVHVEHALGSLGRPMTDADLERKFAGLVNPVLGEARALTLIEQIWKLDELEDLQPLFAYSRKSLAKVGA